jgi:hypothetical protein
VHVILDRAELLDDLLVGPALERAAEIDADQLAEDAGIDALEVIVGKLHVELRGKMLGLSP